MSGTSRSSADRDPRRRKVLFRAWHRGMREVDLILGAFADKEIATLPTEDLDLFEALMDEPDADILKWVTGEVPVPARHDNRVFALILSHRPGAAGKS